MLKCRNLIWRIEFKMAVRNPFPTSYKTICFKNLDGAVIHMKGNDNQVPLDNLRFSIKGATRSGEKIEIDIFIKYT